MKRLTYERRVQLLALAAGLPGSFIALILLWTGTYSSGAAWTLTFLILSLWLGFVFSLRHRVVFLFADALQSPGGHAGRGFLHPRARRASR